MPDDTNIMYMVLNSLAKHDLFRDPTVRGVLKSLKSNQMEEKIETAGSEYSFNQIE